MIGTPEETARSIQSVAEPAVPVEPITTFPEAVVWLIVPTVTVVLSSSTVGPALGNCVIASTALGIMPSLQAVPVVQGVVPDVGNQMDCAAATHGVMPASSTNAHRTARPTDNTVMIPPPRTLKR